MMLIIIMIMIMIIIIIIIIIKVMKDLRATEQIYSKIRIFAFCAAAGAREGSRTLHLRQSLHQVVFVSSFLIMMILSLYFF